MASDIHIGLGSNFVKPTITILHTQSQRDEQTFILHANLTHPIGDVN